MRALDASGAQVYAEEYLYATNGALRQVRRSANPETTSSLLRCGPRRVFPRSACTGVARILSFATTCKDGSRTVRRDREPHLSRARILPTQGDTELLKLSTLSEPGHDTVVDRTYDDKGSLALETTTTKGTVVLTDTTA